MLVCSVLLELMETQSGKDMAHGTPQGAVMNAHIMLSCILIRCLVLVLSSLLTRANSYCRSVSNSYMARQDAF